MTGMFADHLDQGTRGNGAALFVRRWLAHPLRMGSVIPSSRALCRLVVRHAWPEAGGVVLDLGSGTGVIARAFLQAGLPPDRLVAVEVDRALAAALRTGLPGATVLEGDGRALADLIPDHLRGRITSVICGIPLVLLAKAEQRAFIDAIESVAPGRGFVLYSYCVTSPIPTRAHALVGRREAWTPLNFPPASLWRYVPVRRGG